MPYTDNVKVKGFSQVTPEDLGFREPETADPDAALDALLDEWIKWIHSEIVVRMGEKDIKVTDSRYDGIVGIETRYVANLIEAAKQMKLGTVVAVSDFRSEVVQTTEFFQHLDADLAPHRRTKLAMISSVKG